MQHELQKYWNVSDVNCDPLSETNISSRSCWLNSHLRMAIIEQVSAFCIGKISGYLEWVSTTTKKLPPLIGPAKSTCVHDHGYSGHLSWKTSVADGLSVDVASA